MADSSLARAEAEDEVCPLLRDAAARVFAESAKRRAEDDLIIEHELTENGLFKRPRNTGPRPGGGNDPNVGRPDYSASPWAVMLRDPRLRDPMSAEARVFRTRFRLPFRVFERLLEWTKAWHEGPGCEETLVGGRQRIPTELKLLGVLRILGRGSCFDGIKELSSISGSTMQAFFHKFTAWFREVGRALLRRLALAPRQSHRATVRHVTPGSPHHPTCSCPAPPSLPLALSLPHARALSRRYTRSSCTRRSRSRR